MISKNEVEKLLLKSKGFYDLVEYIDDDPSTISEISREDLMYINNNGDLDEIITSIDESIIIASFDMYNFLKDKYKYVLLKETFLMRGDN